MCRRCLSTLLVLTLVATTVLLAGCGDETATVRKSAAPAELVRVSGSGTALPAFTLLAEEYGSSQIKFSYLPGLHSGGGIQGVASGDLELGIVSRELTAQEKSLGLEYVKFADDGLVIAVNSSVTIEGLTSQQVRDIYSGAYTNWQELGGPDLGIVILDRAEDESAKIIMRKYILGSDLKVSPSAVAMSYEPDMIAGLRQTKGAIGYFSLGVCLSRAIPVRMLKLDGVPPSVAAIASGEYKMVRPLGAVVHPPAAPELAEFLTWACGPDGAAFLAGKGFAPPVRQ